MMTPIITVEQTFEDEDSSVTSIMELFSHFSLISRSPAWEDEEGGMLFV